MIVTRLLLTAAFVFGGASAHAQTEPEAFKTADQITCELTQSCGEEAAAPVQERGESRKFSLAVMPKGGSASQSSAALAKPAMRPGGNRPTTYAAPAIGASSSGTRVRNIAMSHPTKLVRSGASAATPASSNLAVGFALASDKLDTAGKRQADALLGALRGPMLAGKHVVIAGHTDSVGGREYNIDLSQRRARALVDYLAANRISPSLLEPIGYGFDRPLPGLNASEGRNRRVEVVIADVTKP